MGVPLIDLTFFEKNKYLWDREMVGKVDAILRAFLESDYDQAKEPCFFTFCNKFNDARTSFENDIRDLSMIMKCRVKGDSSSRFGGQQCATFMNRIVNIVDEYLSLSIYLNSVSEFAIPCILKRIKARAESDKLYALEFENKAMQEYQNFGIDISWDIFKQSGWSLETLLDYGEQLNMQY